MKATFKYDFNHVRKDLNPGNSKIIKKLIDILIIININKI
jgi:hypothetical protein